MNGVRKVERMSETEWRTEGEQGSVETVANESDRREETGSE
jgi:hypothetical protein